MRGCDGCDGELRGGLASEAGFVDPVDEGRTHNTLIVPKEDHKQKHVYALLICRSRANSILHR